MTTIDVTPIEFPEALRELVRLTVRDVRAAAMETAHRGVALAVSKTNTEGLVDLGLYKNSWIAAPIFGPEGGAEIRNDAPYAGVIELGRRPGRPGPPFEPILRWVESKLVRNGEIEPEEAFDVAHAIRASIHVKGTPGRHVLGGIRPKVSRFYKAAALRLIRKRTGGA